MGLSLLAVALVGAIQANVEDASLRTDPPAQAVPSALAQLKATLARRKVHAPSPAPDERASPALLAKLAPGHKSRVEELLASRADGHEMAMSLAQMSEEERSAHLHEMLQGKGVPPTPAPTPKPTPQDYRFVLPAFDKQGEKNWFTFEQNMRNTVSELESELLNFFGNLKIKYDGVLDDIAMEQKKWDIQMELVAKSKQHTKDKLTENTQLFQQIEGQYDKAHHNMAEDLRKTIKSFVPWLLEQMKALRWKTDRMVKDTRDLRTYWQLNVSGFERQMKQELNAHEQLVTDLSFDNQDWMKEFYTAQVTQLRRMGKLALAALKRADALEKKMMTGFVDAFQEFSERKANRVKFMNDALMGMQAEVEGVLDSFQTLTEATMKEHDTRWDQAIDKSKTAEVEARDGVANELTTWRQEFTNDVNDLTAYAGTVEGKMDSAETAVQQADDVINTKETTFNLGKAKFERKRDLLAKDVDKSAETANKYIYQTFNSTMTKIGGLAARSAMRGETEIMKAVTAEKDKINAQVNALINNATEDRSHYDASNVAGQAAIDAINAQVKAQNKLMSYRPPEEENPDGAASGDEQPGLIPRTELAEQTVKSDLARLETKLADGQNAMKEEIRNNSDYVRATLADDTQFIGTAPIHKTALDSVTTLNDDQAQMIKDMKGIKSDFDTATQPLKDTIKAQKAAIGTWMGQASKDTKDSIKATEGIVHDLLPNSYEHVRLQAQTLIEHVKAIETKLSDGLNQVAVNAQLGMEKQKATFAEQGAQATQELGEKLLTEEENAKADVDVVEHQAAKNSQEIQRKGREQLMKAQEADTVANHVEEQVPKEYKKLTDKITHATAKVKEVKPDVNGFNRKLVGDTQDMQAKATYLGDHADSFIESKIREMLNEVETRAEGLSQVVTNKGGALQQYAETQSSSILAEVKHLKTELRDLDSRMRGVAKDQDEWAKNLNSAILGAEQQAAHLKMIGGKNKLETQAAIEERFGSILGLVNQQVHGLDVGAQKAAKDLVEAAKKKAEVIAHSVHLSEEEKAERLRKLDSWLNANIQDVHDASKQVSDGIAATGELSTEADHEVEARIAALQENMENMDAADAVAHNWAETAQTGATMDELIKDAGVELSKTGKAFMSEMGLASGQHEQQADQLTKQMDARLHAKLDELKVQEISRDEEQRKAESIAQNRSETLEGLLDDAKYFIDTSDSKALALAERLGTHARARDDRVDKVGHWAKKFANDGATTMEKTVALLMELNGATDRQVKKDAARVTEWASRFETAQQSDGYKLLKEIRDADKSVDAINTRDENLMHWMGVYGNETHKWRRAVAVAMDDLGASLTDELESIENQAKEYEAALKRAMEGERDKALEEALHMMQGEEQDFQSAEANLADSEGGLKKLFDGDAAENQRSADAAARGIANGFANAGAGDASDGAKQLQGDIEGKNAENKKLDMEIEEFLARQLEMQAEEKKARMTDLSRTRLAIHSSGAIQPIKSMGEEKAEAEGDQKREVFHHDVSLLQKAQTAGLLAPAVASGLALSDPAAKQAMAKALSRNKALTDKHKALMARLHALKFPMALAEVSAEAVSSEIPDLVAGAAMGAVPMAPQLAAQAEKLERMKEDMEQHPLEMMGMVPPRDMPPDDAIPDDPDEIEWTDPSGQNITQEMAGPGGGFSEESGFENEDGWAPLYMQVSANANKNTVPDMPNVPNPHAGEINATAQAELKRMDAIQESMQKAQSRYHLLRSKHAELEARLSELALPYELKRSIQGAAEAEMQKKGA